MNIPFSSLWRKTEKIPASSLLTGTELAGLEAPVQEQINNEAASRISSIRLAGYSLIATHPCNQHGSLSTVVEQTFHPEHIAVADGKGLVVAYANFITGFAPGTNNISGELSNRNPIVVKAALQERDETNFNNDAPARIPVSWQGRRRLYLAPDVVAFSDQIGFEVRQNQRFFSRTAVSLNIYPAPTNPVCTPNTTGGTLPASTYNVGIVIAFPDGDSALALAQVTTTTATSSITVTAPAAVAGALGYMVFLGSPGAATNTGLFQHSDIIPFGTNHPITALASGLAQIRYLQLYAPNGGGVFGSGTYTSPAAGIGEGHTAKNAVDDGMGSATNSATSSSYRPVAILAKTDVPLKTWAIVGDSKLMGSGDAGGLGDRAGWGVRACLNQLQPGYDDTINPTHAYVNLAQAGERAQTFANRMNSKLRMQVYELATNAVCNYGINDLTGSRTLAQLKTDILAIAAMFHIRGMKVFQATLEPYTTTTNFWRTEAGQSLQAVESTRVAYNDWVRDPGPTGFAQQTGRPELCVIVETCQYLEVNAAGALTLNGGYWRTDSTVHATYTVSSTTNTTLINISSAIAKNQWRGYQLLVVSGAQAGQVRDIVALNSTSALGLLSSLSVATGDTVQIIRTATPDGIHHSSWGHALVAQAFRETFGEMI